MVVRFILIAGPGANKYSMSTQALRLVALGCGTIYPCIQFRPSLHLQQICSEISRFGCSYRPFSRPTPGASMQCNSGNSLVVVVATELAHRLLSSIARKCDKRRCVNIGSRQPEAREEVVETRAAVAFKAGEPLKLEKVQLDGPKDGEVLVEINATGICHTDEFTLSGGDPEGLFPAILGHEGAGVVVDVGPGVSSVAPGDHVIPLYTPECRSCKSCLSRKTNLCTAIRATQGKGLMPDGTSRFSVGKQMVHHYMGCSTFSHYTVLPEIALAKIREDAPFEKVCYIGCGVTTGIGAVINTAKVEPGANVVVFGLGGIGLNVIQGARLAGANKIIGVDINPRRKGLAERFGRRPF